jgi:hypothetical protein
MHQRKVTSRPREKEKGFDLTTKSDESANDHIHEGCLLSSGMWHCVDLELADVSEERIASIFRVDHICL